MKSDRDIKGPDAQLASSQVPWLGAEMVAGKRGLVGGATGAGGRGLAPGSRPLPRSRRVQALVCLFSSRQVARDISRKRS